MRVPYRTLKWSQVQQMPLRPHQQFSEAALRQSEAILGHKCNEDQRASVARLRDGMFAVHGPPGTGTNCFCCY